MKLTYIAVRDYGTGAVFYRLFADNKSKVERIFPPPRWKVFEEGAADCPPNTRDLNLAESDIDEPKQWLQEYFWRQLQEEKGRRPFYFESRVSGKLKYLEVWAETEAQVLVRYPALESMMNKCQTDEIISDMILCDIDGLDFHL